VPLVPVDWRCDSFSGFLLFRSLSCNLFFAHQTSGGVICYQCCGFEIRECDLRSSAESSSAEEGWRYVDWNTTLDIDEDDSVWVRVTVVDDLGASSDDTVGPFTVDNVAPHHWQYFSPTDWVADQTPDCTIEAKDITAGIDVSAAYYSYSTDGGSSWSIWTSASCTGSDGATSYQTLTADSVSFNQDSGTQNKIKFRIDVLWGILARVTSMRFR